MFYIQNIIDILDRKFRYVVELRNGIFFLEIKKFMEFLFTSSFYKYHIISIVDEINRNEKEFKHYCNDIKPHLVKIKNKIIKKYPNLNDSKCKRPNPTDVEAQLRYRETFAYFNEIIKGKYKPSYSMDIRVYDDYSDVRVLLNILNGKISRYEFPVQGQEKKIFDEEIKFEILNTEKHHIYEHRKYVNFNRVSPGTSLSYLINTIQAINPQPHVVSSFSELLASIGGSEEFLNRSFIDRVQKAVYEYDNDLYQNIHATDYGRRRQECETHLRRVYEELRNRIGTRLSYFQVFGKYKARCMWYDHERLSKLISTKKQKCEHLLTLELAKYLFDNDITMLYRSKFGKHELDLFDPSLTSPIFVEVKVYRDSNARRIILNGFFQIHSYLNNIGDRYPVREAFYIIYRLGGPLYDLPKQVSYNNFTITTFIIDLAESKVSGSRQPKPVVIDLEDILNLTKTK